MSNRLKHLEQSEETRNNPVFKLRNEEIMKEVRRRKRLRLLRRLRKRKLELEK